MSSVWSTQDCRPSSVSLLTLAAASLHAQANTAGGVASAAAQYHRRHPTLQHNIAPWIDEYNSAPTTAPHQSIDVDEFIRHTQHIPTRTLQHDTAASHNATVQRSFPTNIMRADRKSMAQYNGVTSMLHYSPMPVALHYPSLLMPMPMLTTSPPSTAPMLIEAKPAPRRESSQQEVSDAQFISPTWTTADDELTTSQQPQACDAEVPNALDAQQRSERLVLEQEQRAAAAQSRLHTSVLRLGPADVSAVWDGGSEWAHALNKYAVQTNADFTPEPWTSTSTDTAQTHTIEDVYGNDYDEATLYDQFYK